MLNLSNVQIAGIAQLVERNLAKVEVASSSLVSRSKHRKKCQHLSTEKGKLMLPFFALCVDRVRHEVIDLHTSYVRVVRF